MKNSGYYEELLGYIRVNALDETDYMEISHKFVEDGYNVPKNIDYKKWLYYKANASIFNYYFEKGKKYKALNRKKGLSMHELDYFKQLRQKYVYMYRRLLESDLVFNKILKSFFKALNFDGENGLANDLIREYEEIIRKDLICIVAVRSHAHEKLIFCYKNLINYWSSKDILFKLRKKLLDNLLIDFVNEYSEITGIRNPIVYFHFIPMVEYLGNSGSSGRRLNSFFTKVDLKEYLSSHEKHLLLKKLITGRVKIIDKWNERMKYRIIKSLLK